MSSCIIAYGCFHYTHAAASLFVRQKSGLTKVCRIPGIEIFIYSKTLMAILP